MFFYIIIVLLSLFFLFVYILTDDNLLTFKICSFLVAVFLPLMIFMTPKIFYEKQGDGYAVRFYAYGLLNYKSATIPEEYKGKKVIALRPSVSPIVMI